VTIQVPGVAGSLDAEPLYDELAPKPVPPSQIKPSSTSIGTYEGEGAATPPRPGKQPTVTALLERSAYVAAAAATG
jgi:hypothetical protein